MNVYLKYKLLMNNFRALEMNLIKIHKECNKSLTNNLKT